MTFESPRSNRRRFDSRLSSTHSSPMNYRTRQREAVQTVLAQQKRPLTAQSILERAQKICPGIGAATVFRALKEGVASGEIRRVELPGLAPHYESAHQSHHHFFVCQSCHEVQPLPGCVQGLGKLLPKGSRMQSHELVIFGDCPVCASP